MGEAIWQLKKDSSISPTLYAIQEASNILPNPLRTAVAHYCLTTTLLNAFEPGDLRRIDWVDTTNNTGIGGTPGSTYYPYKYKIGPANNTVGPFKEYYMIFRLAEIYLIRAEAEAGGATGGTAAAITDLNTIRSRAGLPGLSTSLLQPQVVTAVAHERQIELFGEWGHRWLDLKRTGQAHDVLSALSSKQPWAGDYQLLYPIPPTEIQVDHFLVQNPGY